MRFKFSNPFSRKKKTTSKKQKVNTNSKQLKTIEASKKEIQDLANYKTVDVSNYIAKKSRIDKLRKFKTEVEVSRGSGQIKTSYSCKIESGIYFTWKEGRETFQKIIVLPPSYFEKGYLFGLWWSRGLKFYYKKGSETNHDPDASAFSIPNAKFAMRTIKEAIKNEQYVQLAKATKPSNRKELLIWVGALVIIAFFGMAGSGDYFK